MADTIMNLEPITLPGIENKRPLVIAGPCSAETEDQVLETAKELAAQGIPCRNMETPYQTGWVRGRRQYRTALVETCEGRNGHVCLDRGSQPIPCIRSTQIRRGYSLDRCPYRCESFLDARDSRCIERRGHSYPYQKPRQSRP